MQLRPRRRDLDDEQLDSGDDEGRFDRRGSQMEEDAMDYGETLNVMDVNLARAPEPESMTKRRYECDRLKRNLDLPSGGHGRTSIFVTNRQSRHKIHFLDNL